MRTSPYFSAVLVAGDDHFAHHAHRLVVDAVVVVGPGHGELDGETVVGRAGPDQGVLPLRGAGGGPANGAERPGPGRAALGLDGMAVRHLPLPGHRLSHLDGGGGAPALGVLE